jgi:hypothetical protein
MMKLRMRGAIPSLPSYAFVAWTGTAWPYICSCAVSLCSLRFTYCTVSYVQLWILTAISVYDFTSISRQRRNRVFSSALMHYCRSCISEPIPAAARSKAWACGPRLLVLPVRIPPGSWVSVSCECCELSVKGLCDDPITRPEASCRMCVCVCVCHWVWSGATITDYTYNDYVEEVQTKK